MINPYMMPFSQKPWCCPFYGYQFNLSVLSPPIDWVLLGRPS